jgi:hypothetical protein
MEVHDNPVAGAPEPMRGTLGREQARRLAQPLGDPAIRPL